MGIFSLGRLYGHARANSPNRLISDDYHLLAENDESSYVAYVSQQNLILEPDGGPVQHPAVQQMFDGFERGRYKLRPEIRN